MRMEAMFENNQSCPHDVVHRLQSDLVYCGEGGVQTVFTEIVYRTKLSFLLNTKRLTGNHRWPIS